MSSRWDTPDSPTKICANSCASVNIAEIGDAGLAIGGVWWVAGRVAIMSCCKRCRLRVGNAVDVLHNIPFEGIEIGILFVGVSGQVELFPLA